MIFIVICVFAVCVGLLVGVYVAAMIFNDESKPIKIRDNERRGKVEKKKKVKKEKENKVNQKFTDTGDSIADETMGNYSPEQAVAEAERERKTQTEAYNYAGRK